VDLALLHITISPTETIKYLLTEIVVSEKIKSGKNILSLMNNI